MTEPAPRLSKSACLIAIGVWLLTIGALSLIGLFLIGACPHRGDPSFVLGSILLFSSPLTALVPAILAGWLVARLRRRN